MTQRPLAPPARQVIPGQLPHRVGQIIGAVPISDVKGAQDLTASELALLQRGGYQDGDPVPDLANTTAGLRLRKQVEEVVREASSPEGKLPIDPSVPPLRIQTPRDISTLSPAEATKAEQVFKELYELQQRMSDARVQAAATSAAVDPRLGIPGYADAIASTQGPAVDLVDDIGLTGDRPPLKLKQPEPPPPVENKGGADVHEYKVGCPRCGFDLNGPLVTATQDDKVSYMAVVMGDQPRFRRKVPLFGGRITLVFRSLLSSEEDLAISQVDEDAKNGKISNLVLYAATMEDYKMLMSIESLQRRGKPAITMAPVADYAFDDTKQRTALPELKRWLDDEIFPVASVRHAAINAYQEFMQILQMMEVHAPDSDFFDGIA